MSRSTAFLFAVIGVAVLGVWSGAARADDRAVEDGDNKAATWRALLIAGDTVSPVFNNALNALKQRLIGLGVPAENITSVQSGPSLGDATAKVEDISSGFEHLKGSSVGPCFLYATSHGTERGLLFALADGHTVLVPNVVDAWLDTACRNTHTVVVLSGCYSGVYVDALEKADNRIILSAARRDRVSFGCSARDELNVYDRCFLQNLRADRTWRDVAEAVRSCVEREERAFGEVPSLPQTFLGKAAADTLVGRMSLEVGAVRTGS